MASSDLCRHLHMGVNVPTRGRAHMIKNVRPVSLETGNSPLCRSAFTCVVGFELSLFSFSLRIELVSG